MQAVGGSVPEDGVMCAQPSVAYTSQKDGRFGHFVNHDTLEQFLCQSVKMTNHKFSGDIQLFSHVALECSCTAYTTEPQHTTAENECKATKKKKCTADLHKHIL